MRCFTSISYSFLPRARILARTLKEHNPDWDLHVVIAEPLDPRIDVADEPFASIIGIDQLGIPDLTRWLFKHDVTEACTAVKAWAFEYIMEQLHTDQVVYFDPDIAVFSDLGEIDQLLEQFPILLTPHQTEPNTEAEDHFHEENFLRCGTYNLGFLALRNQGQGREFLRWWKDRTTELCYDESPLGLFTDQRWCDLAPCFFDQVHILRDPGHNVSAWNIAHRKLSRGGDGGLKVNDAPLRFFHFSKYGTLDYRSAVLENSSHAPLVVELVDWYEEELARNGQAEFGRRPWFYDRFHDGEPVTAGMRRYYRQHAELEDYFPDPFMRSPGGGFLHWWVSVDVDGDPKPAPGGAGLQRAPTKVSAEDVERIYDGPACDLRRLALNSTQKPPAAPTISILIPSSGKLGAALYCLGSIVAAEEAANCEVILIGNLPDIDSKGLMLPANAKYQSADERSSIGALCNAAARSAKGRFLAVVDELSTVRGDWLVRLQEVFTAFPRTGLVCSRQTDIMTKQCSVGAVLDDTGRLQPIGWGLAPDDPAIGHIQRVDVASGSIMVPTSVWDEVGGMNISLSARAAFTDLSVRMSEAGYEVRNQPHSTVLSHEANRDDLQHSADLLSPGLSTALSRQALARHVSPTGRVLYVDDRTPQPDVSAGGAYSFNCLRILNSLGFEVTFIAAWEEKCDPRYIRALQSLGVRVLHQPVVSGLHDHIRQEGYLYDLVVLCRAPVAAYYGALIRNYAPQAKVALNTIDLHFMRLERQAQVTHAAADIDSARRMREKELGVVDRADVTMVVSDAEQALLRSLAPSAKVALVPIPIDIPGSNQGFDQRRDIAFLGGYEHAPNVDAVKYFVQEIWPLVSRRLPGAKFIIAGSKMPPEFSSFASDTVEPRGFVSDLAGLYGFCRLSVVPLRFGAGVKGKILASMSFGVPNVVTRVSAEGMQLTDGKEVLIADSPEGFAAAVERAYTQPEVWRGLSERGLEYLRQKASLATVSKQFEQMLVSLDLMQE